MLRDLRHGLRVLLQAKGWTAVVVLSLAVGIGANAAIFTAVNSLLLRTLPVDDPDSLVRIRWSGPNQMANNESDYGMSAPGPDGESVRTTFSYPMFQHFRSANQTMIDLAGSRPAGITVTIDGRAETASALLVTGNYHTLLGATTQIGRPMTREDDNPAAPAVATLSDRYWRTRFAADPGVLGKNHQHQQSSCNDRRRDRSLVYGNAACYGPASRSDNAAEARRSHQRRRSAHG
jgi:hypothetical protein